MAITQQNIIDEIPRVLYRENSRVLTTLSIMAIYGWGVKSKLYKRLEQLIQDSETCGSKVVKIDKETFSVSPVVCDTCWDNKKVFKLDDKNTCVTTNCPDCSSDKEAKKQ